MLVFQVIGSCCGPLFHKLGAVLLTEPRLVGMWARLAEMPLVPWTRFNHTAVMGAMVLSLALFWPAFLLSLPLFSRFAPGLHAALVGSAPYRWLMRDDAPAEAPR
jgi:uncharacterized protein (TIGR03546 family)